ncbi:MAG: GNAT family N-acetyltransferase [Anaerolineae bacterium]|nr:GNAT family N-acetyltransferase [Anaerolineae bacterium]
MYVAWLNNSVFNGYAVDSVLAFQGERLIGIHTVKTKQGVGIVDLIGIIPDLQNAGLGGALLKGGFDIMRAHGATRVEVVTENENIQGSRFYQKNGFRLTDMKLVWHRHA